jgi:hypothetical protein
MQAEAVFYSFRFVFFWKTNTPGQPGRDFWMDGRLILSFQDAMQTGGYPHTDDRLSVTGPRSSVSSVRNLPEKGLFTTKSPERSRAGFTIHHSPSTIQCASPYSFRFVFFWNEYPCVISSSLCGALVCHAGPLLRGAGGPGLTGDDVAILDQHGQQASTLRWFETWVLAKRGTQLLGLIMMSVFSVRIVMLGLWTEFDL